MLIFANLCLWFFIYSLLGWLYETLLCSIQEKHFVKRGFLIGPYCPIYGVGAFINILVLSEISNPIILFFTGMILAGFLEYFTGNLMEKIFHARWWDYSGYRFNLHGHICLSALVVFGLMAVIQITYFQPILSNITGQLPDSVLLGSALIACVLISFDTVLALVIKRREFHKAFKSVFPEFSFWFSVSTIHMSEKLANIRRLVFYNRTE